MYDIVDYGRMISDKVRMGAYSDALRRSVDPDSVVLDIGTGTGIFALLACVYGARRVFAVEPDDAIVVAEQSAIDNGLADRITFIQDTTQNVTLPERADVVISDLRGTLPLHGDHIASIADARDRLAKPNAKLIPRRDTLWVAVVQADDLYWDRIAHWSDATMGLDLQAGRPYAANTKQMCAADDCLLLSNSAQWHELDYSSVRRSAVSGRANLNIEAGGTGHGLLLWFDTELHEGVGFSNAPGRDELIYGRAFLPLESPLPLAPGSTLSVKIRADLVGDQYVWSWETSVAPSDTEIGSHLIAKQTTLRARPLAPARLRTWSAEHVPQLAELAAVDRLALELLEGRASLGTVADRLAESYPTRFATWEDALTHVAALADRYRR